MFEVFLFSLAGGLLSLLGGLLLIRSNRTAVMLAKYATPFAAGVLLATGLTDLIPEALHEGDERLVFTYVLFGILLFFFLERFLRFFHHHHEADAKSKSSNSLVIIGDTLHNALDGIAIGAAFLINPTTGIITTLAVAAHEIPQEIGDFGLLLKNGMKKKTVIVVNAFSALATVLAAVATYAIGDADSAFIPYVLAITAGFFIYIAASDIIPELHEKITEKRDLRPWLLLVGALFVLIVSPIAHEYIESSDVHDESSEAGKTDDEPHEDEDNHEQ